MTRRPVERNFAFIILNSHNETHPYPDQGDTVQDLRIAIGSIQNGIVSFMMACIFPTRAMSLLRKRFLRQFRITFQSLPSSRVPLPSNMQTRHRHVTVSNKVDLFMMRLITRIQMLPLQNHDLCEVLWYGCEIEYRLL